jgi:hypothetical protein
MQPIGPGGIALRFLFALILVLCTYNPSGYSYFHWLKDTLPGFTPVLAISGIVLIIGWVIYIRATFRSLGPIGLTLAALFLAALVWLFIDMGWLSLDSFTAFSWIFIVVLSVILTIGMSWSHIRRRMSGQVDMDDVDED